MYLLICIFITLMNSIYYIFCFIALLFLIVFLLEPGVDYYFVLAQRYELLQ